MIRDRTRLSVPTKYLLSDLGKYTPLVVWSRIGIRQYSSVYANTAEYANIRVYMPMYICFPDEYVYLSIRVVWSRIGRLTRPGSFRCCCWVSSVLSKIQHIASDVSDWIFEMSESGKIRRMRRPISEILETRVLSRWNPEKTPKQTSFASWQPCNMRSFSPSLCLYLFLGLSMCYKKSACCSVLPKIQRVAGNSVCCRVWHCSVLQRVVAKNKN